MRVALVVHTRNRQHVCLDYKLKLMKSIQTKVTKFKGELIPFKTGLLIVAITLILS